MKKLFSKIWRTEGQEDISSADNLSADFILLYKELPIGNLSTRNGVWKFSYTERFRLQSDLSPLIDFPNTNEEYTSHQLWPFFSYRIPGLNQPKVQEIMRKEHIQNNELALLKKFGENSIYNPFLLKIAQ
jgi:HipA-like protein